MISDLIAHTTKWFDAAIRAQALIWETLTKLAETIRVNARSYCGYLAFLLWGLRLHMCNLKWSCCGNITLILEVNREAWWRKVPPLVNAVSQCYALHAPNPWNTWSSMQQKSQNKVNRQSMFGIDPVNGYDDFRSSLWRQCAKRSWASPKLWSHCRKSVMHIWQVDKGTVSLWE